MNLKEQFLQGMSHAACTVNIVTTDGHGGRAGVTVSAMSSVSADTPKPTLLICVHNMSPAASSILKNGVFCVNVLRSDQSYISDTFAGRHSEEFSDKFDCADWTTQITGARRVIDPLVSFDCNVVSSDQVGTHFVFFGEVEDVFESNLGSPLIYANRAYGATTRIEQSTLASTNSIHSADKLSIGCVQTFGPYFLPTLVSRYSESTNAVRLKFIEGSQRKVKESLDAGECDIAFLYDLDLPDNLQKQTLAEISPYVLLPDNHPLSRNPSISAADLKGYKMVLLDIPPSGEYFTKMLERDGVTPDINFRSSSFELVRGLVGQGLGFTLLATKPASAMTYDGFALAAIPFKTSAPAGRIVLCSKSSTDISQAAKAFTALCKDCFDDYI